MKTGIVLLPLAALMGLATAVCAWPAVFGMRAAANGWMVLFGVLVTLAFVGLWLVLWHSERQLENAVELTAFFNNNLNEAERAVLTVTDPYFEANSGLKKWRTPPTGVQKAAVRAVEGVNGSKRQWGRGGETPSAALEAEHGQ